MRIQKYMAKISGTLLDRVDLQIEVPAVNYKELSSKAEGEPSQRIRERVVGACDIQMKRFAGRKGRYGNADMASKDILAHCKLDTASE
jgi:magnesium chelatase family protein